MKLNLIEQDTKTDIEIVIVKNNKIKKNKDILKQLNFTGEDETCVLLEESKVLYVGCDCSEKDNIRTAAAVAIRKLNETNFESAQIKIDDDLREVIEGLELGNYTFDKYKSKKDKKKEKTINIVVAKINKENIAIFEDSINISNSVNLTRDFVNTTPEDFFPETMAKEAKKIAKENNLECKIYGEDYLQENNMHTMLAVGRASRHESKLIHLTYKPKKKAKCKIVLVGKGLTYDSGGLSLKPSNSMVTMKMDKSGGCTVLGVMNTVAKLNLDIEVHGIVGAVENMIGGDAYKPDDVLTAKNGKTIEVRNTDAEGRLVLADCLCYAQDEIKNIDYIFDYATLTGASVVAVGQYTTSLMGNNQDLKDKMIVSSQNSGELATDLPFNKYLRKTIKSKLADICNVSSTRYGGAITAGLFLEEFIEKENKNKWIHCDIAGPAYAEEQWGCNQYGASGAGVRFSLEFMKSLQK